MKISEILKQEKSSGVQEVFINTTRYGDILLPIQNLINEYKEENIIGKIDRQGNVFDISGQKVCELVAKKYGWEGDSLLV